MVRPILLAHGLLCVLSLLSPLPVTASVHTAETECEQTRAAVACCVL